MEKKEDLEITKAPVELSEQDLDDVNGGECHPYGPYLPPPPGLCPMDGACTKNF